MTRHLHTPDYPFLAIIGILLVIGLVMLSSASTVISFQKFGDSTAYLKHQFLFGILGGVVGFLILSKIDYHYWQKLAFLLMMGSLVALLAVLMPGIGYEFGGARRWINIGGFLFQPAELTKLTFVLYLATWLSKRGKEIHTFTYGFIPFVIMLGILTVLVMLQPDLGTMSILGFVGVAIYFVAGSRLRHLGLILLGAAFLFFALVQIAPYRTARLTVFLNPELDPQGIGYHINQALLAIGSGGIFGVGLGHSRQKYNYLPEVTGDSIFAVMAEELGFILSVGFLILFFMLLFRGFKIARESPDLFGRLVACGVSSWIFFQVFINIGSMVSLIPMTGVPLPIVSYGSSAIVTTLAGLGIVLNISKQTKG